MGSPCQWVTVALVETAHPVGPEFRQACRSSSQRGGTRAEGGPYLVGGCPGNIVISTPETYVKRMVGLY